MLFVNVYLSIKFTSDIFYYYLHSNSQIDFSLKNEMDKSGDIKFSAHDGYPHGTLVVPLMER